MAEQYETVPANIMGRLLSKLLGDESLATVQKPVAPPSAPARPVPRGSSGDLIQQVQKQAQDARRKVIDGASGG